MLLMLFLCQIFENFSLKEILWKIGTLFVVLIIALFVNSDWGALIG